MNKRPKFHTIENMMFSFIFYPHMSPPFWIDQYMEECICNLSYKYKVGGAVTANDLWCPGCTLNLILCVHIEVTAVEFTGTGVILRISRSWNVSLMFCDLHCWFVICLARGSYLFSCFWTETGQSPGGLSTSWSMHLCPSQTTGLLGPIAFLFSTTN